MGDIKIDSLERAEFWINVHQRYGIKDAERLNVLTERILWLEKPWWKRIFRKPPPWGGSSSMVAYGGICPPAAPGYDIFKIAEPEPVVEAPDDDDGVDELLHALQEVVLCGECPACRKMCSGTVLKYKQEHP